jgi:hypothetical protein
MIPNHNQRGHQLMCSASEVGGVFGGQAGRGVVGARFPLDGSKHYLGMHLSRFRTDNPYLSSKPPPTHAHTIHGHDCNIINRDYFETTMEYLGKFTAE